jgi:hypothetical protein
MPQAERLVQEGVYVSTDAFGPVKFLTIKESEGKE